MADTPEKSDDVLNTARPHQIDKGHVVKTAFGEKFDGAIADIADGDDARDGAPDAPDGKAHPHQKDKGKVVTTAFGEKFDGGISDIADGDH